MTDHLHVETTGHGQDLVLLHGWAMHGGIWPVEMINKLSESYRVHKVDLPGHGLSLPIEKDFNIDNITETLEQTLLPRLTGKTIFVGWSLGGLVAANLVLTNPEIVDKLVLIASSLRFSKTDDWPDAVDGKILKLFAENLIEDYKTTLSRFLALQFNGDENAREGLRILKQKVFECEVPELKVLKQGLEILLNADLREQAINIKCPLQFIGGEHDTLTPRAALTEIASRIPQSQVSIIKGASHAPFISHQSEFCKILTGFLHV